ncbi:hypothetical protein DSECCO2_604260 [anaerobic digester metagenome]
MNNLLQKLGSDLKETDRKTENVTARYAVFYKLRMDGAKLAVISRLSGYHHSTIVHGVTQFKNLLDSKDKLAVEYWDMIKDDEYKVVATINGVAI